MKLDKWIEKTGPKKVAHLLDASSSSVSHWKAGRNCPRPNTIKRICEVSKGVVSYKDIVLHFVR